MVSALYHSFYQTSLKLGKMFHILTRPLSGWKGEGKGKTSGFVAASSICAATTMLKQLSETNSESTKLKQIKFLNRKKNGKKKK